MKDKLITEVKYNEDLNRIEIVTFIDTEQAYHITGVYIPLNKKLTSSSYPELAKLVEMNSPT